MTALLSLDRVDVVLGRRARATRILSGVDLEVRPGDIVGIIGETGAGKTTLARTIVGLITPSSGEVLLNGRKALTGKGRRSGKVQLVFQDPLRSLDPDLTVLELVAEGLRIRGGISDADVRVRVVDALAKVGLDPELLDRLPAQISGGQRQRVSIARALVMDPELLICDEPVSALDASNRNQVLRLLDDLRTRLGLAIVVISHDLSSLAGIADRVVVLYRGRVVEDGPIAEVFGSPRHPYTALLVASAPSLGLSRPLSPRQLRRVENAPELGEQACVFAARCPFVTSACSVQPAAVAAGDDWRVACHHADTWHGQAHNR